MNSAANELCLKKIIDEMEIEIFLKGSINLGLLGNF